MSDDLKWDGLDRRDFITAAIGASAVLAANSDSVSAQSVGQGASASRGRSIPETRSTERKSSARGLIRWKCRGAVLAVLDVSRPARRWPNQGRGIDLVDLNREWPGNENGPTAPSRPASCSTGCSSRMLTTGLTSILLRPESI
jgi:hypothetical protein